MTASERPDENGIPEETRKDVDDARLMPRERFNIFAPWRRFPKLDVTTVLVGIVIGYFWLSVQTLPFADKVWFGEIPPLALPQLPKTLLKRAIQNQMISQLPRFGLASGSASPDLILTHPWALGLTVVLPVVTVFALLMITRQVRNHRAIIMVLFVFAVLDAIATFWFDRTSRLSLF